MSNQQGMRKLKRAVIKEELVALTGDAVKALILNQLLYWTERAWDFDQFIEEEKARAERNGRRVIMPPTRGWVTKTADQLSDELMLGLSKSNVRRHILCLVEQGWVEERENPNDKWSRTKQYRVNLIKIRDDLARLGYPLEGFAEERLAALPPAGGPGDGLQGPDDSPGSKIEPRESQGFAGLEPGNPGNEGSSILEPRGAEIEPQGSETGPVQVESLSKESPVSPVETHLEIEEVCVCEKELLSSQKLPASDLVLVDKQSLEVLAGAFCLKLGLEPEKAQGVAAALAGRYPVARVLAKLPVAAAAAGTGRIRNLAAFLVQAVEEDWQLPVEVGRCSRSAPEPGGRKKRPAVWRDNKYTDLYLS